MKVFMTVLLILGFSFFGFNKRINDSTRVGFFVFFALVILIFVLSTIF